MTLWFDISDLYKWKRKQLSGIQRASIFVLEHLLSSRSDVRLFRFDEKKLRLVEADPAKLPSDIQNYLGSALQDFAPVAKPISTSTPPPQLRESRRTVRELATKFLPAVKRRLRQHWKPRAVSSAEPKPSLLFEEGDVCVSMAAGWVLDGSYGDVIAANLQGGRVKCINTIYDLTPVLFPHWISEKGHRQFSSWLTQQVCNADLLLTLSNFQKKELEAFIREGGLPQRDIEALRLGDDLLHAPARPRHVPGRPFVLCVSTLNVRKNHGCLYHVWRALAQEVGPACPQLVLIGSHGFGTRDLMYRLSHDPLVKDLVTHLADVHDDELAWYYENCLFTLYPSHYEGWGLPISESLAHGKYCIVGRHDSMLEAGGDLVDYFEPTDYKACFGLVSRAIHDPDYVCQREKNILQRYVPMPWASTARQVGAAVDRMVCASAGQLGPCGAELRRSSTTGRRVVVSSIPMLPLRPEFWVETPLEESKILNLDNEAKILGRFLQMLRPGDCVYDIGANLGLYAIPAAICVGPKGRIEAFEPVPSWKRRLEENVALNGLTNVTCHSVALEAGEADGVLTAKAVQGSGMASLQDGYADAIGSAIMEKVPCRVVRGDRYAANHSLTPPEVIKLDVEGAELGALTGLGNLLDHCRFLLCEVHPRFASVRPEDINNLLRKWGFDVEVLDNRREEFHVLASRREAGVGAMRHYE